MNAHSSEFYQTTDIDLASFLYATGFKIVSCHRIADRVDFAFQDSPELHRAISGLHAGAMVEAKALLHARQHCWRIMIAAKRGGSQYGDL